MRWLAVFAAVLAALWAGIALAFPDHAHRFRLTVEVDTPDGLHSGSSVIEAERKNFGWHPLAPSRYEYRVRGEAVFVDLGGGRNLVAVLAHGGNAEDVSRVISLWAEAHGHNPFDKDVWSGRRELRGGVVELGPPLVPTLVTFADPLDPANVRVVQPYEFEQVFGPGVRFRRTTLEMVPTGWWPASALDLSGVPVTDGVIEQRLPWLAGMNTNLAGTRTVFTNDLRERLGPPSFRRQDP